MAAGENDNGVLGNTHYADDAARVSYPIPFVSTPQAVELTSDNWHSGNYFRTATNQLYKIWFDGTAGHVVYDLVDTNVTRLFGGSNNWFICYEKTDGALYRQEVGNGTIIQVHSGPVSGAWVDVWWGLITIVTPAGTVDMFEDDGIPLYVDIFPGQTIVKAVSHQGVVVGLTGELNLATYTNVPSPITTSTPVTNTLTHANGYDITIGEIYTPHISLLSTGEILANQGVV